MSNARDGIVERLKVLGVPSDYLVELEPGLIEYYRDNRSQLPDLISSILPTDDVQDNIKESMNWLQWLMFEGNPGPVLEDLKCDGQVGVCGAVLGKNETVYICRTCEQYPSCVICGSCFQNGNHKDHDYSTLSLTTSDGFCDCGDVNAWNRGGFCSKHKGAEVQIQPLSDELSKSMGSVIDSILDHWKSSLSLLETTVHSRATLQMLLQLCNCSERLLGFISERMIMSVGLLEILVRAETFMISEDDVKTLQELLLKLLSKPLFKYVFAKAFLDRYSTLVSQAVKECSDDVFRKYSWFLAFSVPIFNVSPLTLYLVKERDLLIVLLECLVNIFMSCAGEDRRLEVNKWVNLYETTIRILAVVQFVLSHAVVAKYVLHGREEIIITWIKLLAFVQGMDSQKKETRRQRKGKSLNKHLPFVLGDRIANIHSLLVAGGFLENNEEEKDFEYLLITTSENYDHQNSSPRPAKVRKLYEKSSVNGAAGRISVINSTSGVTNMDSTSGVANIVSVNLSCLTNECLKSIDSWLKTDETYILESANSAELEALRFLNLPGWPTISYDVTSLDISVHIPLHRLLSKIIQKAVRNCSVGLDSKTVSIGSLDSLSAASFFDNILSGCRPHAFSSFLMEHPLRIRVFCAQVHAGLWRKNGEAAIKSSECYRSGHWSKEALDVDLFLLQCCAALAPANHYVTRLLERFGLSTYLNLVIGQSDVYEPALVHELLTLLIQIIKERKFCGLSDIDSLQREVVHKLAISDVTRSDLVNSLPCDRFRIDGLQEVLDRVAIQSDMNQGMYALRREYWKEVDLYYPHWNSKDVNIVKVRYSQFQTSELTSQLPMWTEIYEPLQGIARIATCDVVLQIIRAVVFYGVYTDKSTSSHAADSVMLTALHLLSLSLDICSQQKPSSRPIIDFAVADLFVPLGNGSGSDSFLSFLVSLMNIFNCDSKVGRINFSLLIANILEKFSLLDSGCLNILLKIAPEVVCNVASHSVSDSGISQGDSFTEVDNSCRIDRSSRSVVGHLINQRIWQS